MEPKSCWTVELTQQTREAEPLLISLRFILWRWRLSGGGPVIGDRYVSAVVRHYRTLRAGGGINGGRWFCQAVFSDLGTNKPPDPNAQNAANEKYRNERQPWIWCTKGFVYSLQRFHRVQKAPARRPSMGGVAHSSLLCWSGSGTRSRRSTQQALGADVLVDVWPMDAVSAAGNFPIAALLGSALEQPWIPCQRDRDRAAILQADAQRVFVETDVGHSLICRYCQNTHSRPPRAVADLPARLIVTCSLRGR